MIGAALIITGGLLLLAARKPRQPAPNLFVPSPAEAALRTLPLVPDGARAPWAGAGDGLLPSGGGVAVKDDSAAYLARTLYGEARGEDLPGVIAVGQVILNRVKSPRYPSTVREVVLQPQQFSAWNGQGAGTLMALTYANDDYRRMLDIARKLIDGDYADIVRGRTHYANVAVVASYYGGKLPAGHWINQAKDKMTIGLHTFMNA